MVADVGIVKAEVGVEAVDEFRAGEFKVDWVRRRMVGLELVKRP